MLLAAAVALVSLSVPGARNGLSVPLQPTENDVDIVHAQSSSDELSIILSLRTEFKQTGSEKYPGAKVKKEMYLVNGTIVGPTIVAHKNDVLSITVKNNLLSGVANSMHWHGMYAHVQTRALRCSLISFSFACADRSECDWMIDPAGTRWERLTMTVSMASPSVRSSQGESSRTDSRLILLARIGTTPTPVCSTATAFAAF